MERDRMCQKAKYILSKGLLIQGSKTMGTEEKHGDRALIFVTGSLCATQVLSKRGVVWNSLQKTIFKLFDVIQTYRIQHICNL